jgi:hypothetical protein
MNVGDPLIELTKEEKAVLDEMMKVYIEKIKGGFPLGTPWPKDLMSLLKKLSEYESAVADAKKHREAKQKMSWISYLRWKWKYARKEAHRRMMLADAEKYTEALKGTGDIDLDKLEVQVINGEKYYVLK